MPEALAAQAANLGLQAVALTDRDGLYGTPRFHAAARDHGIRQIIGAELTMEDHSILPVLVESREGYQNLCRLITRAKLRGTKNEAPVQWSDLGDFAHGLVALTGDEEGPVRRAIEIGDPELAQKRINQLLDAFGTGNVFVELQRPLQRGEAITMNSLADLASANRLPLLATGGVLYAEKSDRPVLDVFTCARHHTHLDAAGRLLNANSERVLRSPTQMHALFCDRPEAVVNTVALGERLRFSLKEIGYQFPKFPVPEGESMDGFLYKITMDAARKRYSPSDNRARAQLERELALIAKLGFSGYFLIVWDLVNYCAQQGILVQGRGSAANSAVCYSLGITACDPIACDLLFERFLSEGRSTWPDIDLDLPSGDRREAVIQEVYRRYGEHGAAMTANVITFRGKGAMREIGKALNLPDDILGRFSALYSTGDFPHTLEVAEQLERSGLPRAHPRYEAALSLFGKIRGLPRHLGQHSGGMIISQGNLSSIIPLENASMQGRVVAQWDKYDCESLGIIKVDLLGLGMMAALQDTLELCSQRDRAVDLASIPKDDAATYDLMCRADTVGLFQIESRAQMVTLPRIKPRCFYDVVIQVAIIRPGPIQGDMVHPFLARRAGKAPVTYLHPDLEPVLARTLGVPLFQEQLLRIAMIMADFSGAEAEELRRALSDRRSEERMERVCAKVRASMALRGHSVQTAEQVIQSMRSFALYGFPESHAISFALIAYASAWMKVHRAPEFFAALLNNQPMGFYSSATLIKDAQSRGVRVLPVSICDSEWRCTVNPDDSIRLGMCMVRGLASARAEQLLEARRLAPFRSIGDLRSRTTLNREELRTLARIGALNQLGTRGIGKKPEKLHRRSALWEIESPPPEEDLFNRRGSASESNSPLMPMSMEERVSADFAGTGVTTGPHPTALWREHLPDAWTAAEIKLAPQGTYLELAGMVISRQRPGTAKGFVFLSLEDETGIANVILDPALYESARLVVHQEAFLLVRGMVQQHEGITHLRAAHVERCNAR
jgi:error-prone DNA polymerase